MENADVPMKSTFASHGGITYESASSRRELYSVILPGGARFTMLSPGVSKGAETNPDVYRAEHSFRLSRFRSGVSGKKKRG